MDDIHESHACYTLENAVAARTAVRPGSVILVTSGAGVRRARGMTSAASLPTPPIDQQRKIIVRDPRRAALGRASPASRCADIVVWLLIDYIFEVQSEQPCLSPARCETASRR
ncbi:unnamed protein product, partial [Brenthis ino]